MYPGPRGVVGALAVGHRRHRQLRLQVRRVAVRRLRRQGEVPAVVGRRRRRQLAGRVELWEGLGVAVGARPPVGGQGVLAGGGRQGGGRRRHAAAQVQQVPAVLVGGPLAAAVLADHGRHDIVVGVGEARADVAVTRVSLKAVLQVTRGLAGSVGWGEG